MRIRWLLLGTAFTMVVLAVAAVACGDDDEDGGDEATATQPAADEATATPGDEGATVDVSLLEYTVAPDPDSVAAGSITFNASNIGGEEHEFVVIRTDLAADALPTVEDGSVDEGGAGISVVGEIEGLEPTTDGTLTLNLDAGAYVLICNIVDAEGHNHYAEGMTAAFTVTE